MASEYFKYLARNEKPEEPSPPMTRKEKLKNWLHYNWYWLLIGAVLISIAGSILWNLIGVGRIDPDYTFAYIGRFAIPEEQAKAFEERLASLGKDVNGDGKIVVKLNQYPSNRSTDSASSLFYGYAADTLVVADITKGDSYFFLTEDPDAVQRAYQILAGRDGSAPDEDDYFAEDKVLAWPDCPALKALGLDEAVFSKLYLGRRYFVGKDARLHEDDAAFWETITEGANQ